MTRHRILLALLALVICTGTSWATNKLTLSLGSGTLSCNTSTGATGSATLTVKGASGATYPITASTITFTNTGLVVTASSNNASSLASSSSSLTYTVAATPNCSSETGTLSNNAFTFAGSIASAVSGTADATQAVNVAVTTTAATPLSVSPSSVSISCVLNAGGTYTAGSSTFTLSTSATAPIGTGTTPGSAATFSTPPSWLTLSGSNPYSVANSGGVSVTASVTSQACATVGGLGSSKLANLTVTTAAPEPSTATLSIPVTVTIVGPAPLSVTGSAPNGSTSLAPMPLGSTGVYTRGATTLPTATVTLTSANKVYFVVDMSTMPSWLTVNATAGQITSLGGTTTLTFTLTRVADSLTPGTYTTGVNGIQAIALKVAGYASTPVYLTVTVQSPAPTLSVQGGTTQNLSWSLGQVLPTAAITMVSSSTPIPYTVAVQSGTPDAGAAVSPAAGLAYSFGTTLNVTFSSAAFASASPGTVLYSTVNISWPSSSGTTVTPVNFIVSIQAPSTTATVTGISPSNLPSGAPGETFTAMLYGSGFVASNLASQATFVGIVPSGGGALQKDPNVVALINNSTSITLTITVPSSTDTLLPFSTPGATVTLGVCNPSGNTGNPPCATQSTITFTIDNGPIISPNGVTSGSTFLPGNLAPYDVLSIFGSNFCVSGGTGCANGQVLNAQIVSEVYQNFVTPDVAGSTGERELQVYFCKSSVTAATLLLSTNCFAAPILFATNTQINAIVPGEVTYATSHQWNVYVRFAAAPTSTTTLGSAGTSSAYALSVPSSGLNPGVFIVDSAYDGAIVSNSGPYAGYVTNTATQAARIRPLSNTNNVSDSVQIYMTGLGAPPSTPPASCMTVANYATAVNMTTSNPALDGVILDSSNYSGTGVFYAPCFAAPVSGTLSGTAPITIAIGGQSSTMQYAGWVTGTVAGLYQVNVQLPDLSASQASQLSNGASSPTYVTATSGAVQVPVVISVSGTPVTQVINMYVQPAMVLTDTATGQTATVSLATMNDNYPYTIDTVTATGGNGTAAYALYADSLESAPSTTYFTVDSAAGTVKIAQAIPTGTYTVTVSAADTGGSPSLPTEYITITVVVGS